MNLEQKIRRINSGKYFLGVTGSMGCGKTYTCKKISELSKDKDLELHYYNLDVIGRDIVGKNPDYLISRKHLAEKLGMGLEEDTSINKKELNNKIFYNPELMHYFKQVITVETSKYLQKGIADNKGLILIEWALLVEDKLIPVVDYNVLLVTCDYETQINRLKDGDLPLEQVEKRIGMQMTNEEKEKVIRSVQEQAGRGLLFFFDTSNNPGGGEHECLLEQIIMRI